MSILRRAARTSARTALVTSVATRTHASVAARQQGAAAQQTSAPAASAPAAPAPTAGTQALMDQLRQLGELRDAGVLTTAEFETQKARVLGGSSHG